jgi:hypothetical protein
MRADHPVRKTTRCFVSAVLVASVTLASAAGLNKAAFATALRREEGRPGCTFSRDDDGKYRYGFWTSDFGIILAVDFQELEKARRRAQPILAVQLTLRYRGRHSLDVGPSEITLELVKHYHDAHTTLDPANLARKQ